MREIKQIARLSRLSFSEKELSLYEDFFKRLLEFVDQVSEVEVGSEKPLVNPFRGATKFRGDEIEVWSKGKSVVKQAPSSEGASFKVPPVL